MNDEFINTRKGKCSWRFERFEKKKKSFVVLRHVHPNGLEDAHVGIDPRCIPLVHPGSMNPIPTASIRLFEAYPASRWYTPCR